MNTVLFAIVAATGVSLVVLILVTQRAEGPRIAALATVAFVGHVLFGTVVLPRLPYRWDIPQFHQHALTILNGALPAPNQTVNSFAAFQSIVYAIFAPDPMVLSVVNGLCAVLIAVPVADLANRLYPRLESPAGVIVTVLFLPLPFVFLTIPMRDSLSVLLSLTLLAFVARMLDGDRRVIYPALPLWGCLLLLRPEIAGVIAVAGGAGVAVRIAQRITRRALVVRTLFATGIVSGVFSLLFVGPMLPISSIERRRAFRASGGAAYLEGIGYDNWIELVLATPVRALYFQYAPFPFHISSLFDLVATVMLPILIVLTVAAYRSARECNRDLAVLVLIVVTYFTGIAGYGLIDSNFGTTVRHRIPFTFLLCVLAAPTLEQWWDSLTSRIRLFATVRRSE